MKQTIRRTSGADTVQRYHPPNESARDTERAPFQTPFMGDMHGYEYLENQIQAMMDELTR